MNSSHVGFHASVLKPSSSKPLNTNSSHWLVPVNIQPCTKIFPKFCKISFPTSAFGAHILRPFVLISVFAFPPRFNLEKAVQSHLRTQTNAADFAISFRSRTFSNNSLSGSNTFVIRLDPS
jgi:hypothetical protein